MNRSRFRPPTVITALLVLALTAGDCPAQRASAGRSAGSPPASRGAAGGGRFGGSTGGKSSPGTGRFGGSTGGTGGHVSPGGGKPSPGTGGHVSPGGGKPSPRFGGSTAGRGTGNTGAGSAQTIPAPPAQAPKFNEVGAQAARVRAQQASREAKRAAEAPKTVSTPSGKPHTVPGPVAAAVRPEAARTRRVRETRAYVHHEYGGWHQHQYSSDPFHPLLTGYLLGRLAQPAHYTSTRDWIYAHYDTMDPVRRDELLRENVRLREDVARMRAERAEVGDTSLDLDPDLVYNEQAAGVLYSGHRWGMSAWKVMGWTVLVFLVAVLVWGVFAWRSEVLSGWARSRPGR